MAHGARHEAQVAGFGLEIELGGDGIGEGPHGVDDAQLIGPLRSPVQLLGQPHQDVEVAADAIGDVRALHLDRDALATLELGVVHLGDRSGGGRLGAERPERRERLGKLLGHHDPDHRLRYRVDALLEARQLGGDIR
jgi:hypothetical protein